MGNTFWVTYILFDKFRIATDGIAWIKRRSNYKSSTFPFPSWYALNEQPKDLRGANRSGHPSMVHPFCFQRASGVFEKMVRILEGALRFIMALIRKPLRRDCFKEKE